MLSKFHPFPYIERKRRGGKKNKGVEKGKGRKERSE
jgi:hypothetical protein